MNVPLHVEYIASNQGLHHCAASSCFSSRNVPAEFKISLSPEEETLRYMCMHGRHKNCLTKRRILLTEYKICRAYDVCRAH